MRGKGTVIENGDCFGLDAHNSYMFGRCDESQSSRREARVLALYRRVG